MKQTIGRRRNGLVQITSIISASLIIAAFPAAAQPPAHQSFPHSKPSARHEDADAPQTPEIYQPDPADAASTQSKCLPPNGYGPGEQAIVPYIPGGKVGAMIYRDKNGELNFGFPMSEGVWGTGDWFGLRHKLVDNGVNITGGYGSNVLGNVVGGKRLGASYADQIYVQANLDLQKLIGWKGAHFVVTGLDRNGTAVNNLYTGNVYNPDQIYGSETVTLLMAYLEQNLFNDALNIKAGRMAVTEDFASSPLYGLYVSNGIDGQPSGVAQSGGLSAWPAVVWGARMRFNDKKHDLYAMAGVYQTNAELYSPKSHGLDFGVHSTDGVTLVGEVGWTPEFQPHPKPASFIADKSEKGTVDSADDEEWHGMAGHYKFGGYYTHWASIPTYHGSPQANSSYSLYWLFDQMVYQAKPGSECGLTLWGTFILTPMQQVAQIPYDLGLGAIYTGLIPGRSRDKSAIGLHYGSFSDGYATQLQSTHQGTPTYELVLEACYTIEVSRCLRVQPDVQYIINPGGTGRIPNSLVVGAQIGFSF